MLSANIVVQRHNTTNDALIAVRIAGFAQFLWSCADNGLFCRGDIHGQSVARISGGNRRRNSIAQDSSNLLVELIVKEARLCSYWKSAGQGTFIATNRRSVL
jgi:hypothetical protein